MTQNQGREQIFFKIMVFFAVITAVTGILNLASSGTITLGDLGSSNYGQTIAGQTVPSVGVAQMGTSDTETFGTQDFTTSTGYNNNITKVSTNFISGDTWTRSDGIGYEVSYIPSLYPNLAQISLAGGSSSNNVYDYTYHVYNQFSDYPFYTLVSGVEGGANAISGFYIKYDQNEVSIVNSNAPETPIRSFSYPYANEGQTIETVYDSTQGAVAVYIDGNSVGTFSQVSYAGNTLGSGTGGAGSGSGVYYVGMAAGHTGVQLSSIEGTFVVEEPFNFWSDIMNKINGLVIFGQQFLGLVSAVIGLTSNPLVPFWLWAIIAIPCIATLIIIYIQIARGD